MGRTRLHSIIGLLALGFAAGCTAAPDSAPASDESDVTTGTETAVPTEAKRSASAVLGVSAIL